MSRTTNNHPAGEAVASPEWQQVVANLLIDSVAQLQRKRPGEQALRPDPDLWGRLRHQYKDSRTRRVLVVEFGEQRVFPALLSMFFAAVDVAHFEPSHLMLSRYESGQRTQSHRQRTYSRRRAGAGSLISMFVEEEVERLGSVDVTLIVGPDVAPRAAQDIVDLVPVPYVAVAEEASYEYSMLRFWVGATAVYLKSTRIQEEWRAAHLVPANPINVSDIEGLLGALGGALETTASSAVVPANGKADHRILLVSYFAPPTTPVSVQRLNYWHRNLPRLAAERGKGLDVTWLTATRGAEGLPGMMVVPDPGELRTSEDGWRFIEDLRRQEVDRLSASWADRVAVEAPSWDAGFDTIIMSGNPFYYFRLASLFKELWGAKVILDFRDPFAWNPRFNYSIPQRAFFMNLEREMVSAADAVISVNNECLIDIAPGVDVIRRIVSNGFNEDVVDSNFEEGGGANSDLIRVVYTGTVFRNLPLDDVLDALPEGRVFLDHYGRDYSLTQAVQSHPSGRAHGLMPYVEMVKSIRGADAGIVMTSGESSTQTTKLFDYIACDLDIIIVTDGEPLTGNLHDVTAELDGVFWVRNEPADLKRFFASYVPTRASRPQRASFSRRSQTEGLLELVLELEDL
ncbi:MAG: hypothetical protein DWQ40_08565 [Actinobacteria bacterium]|nr:MAG: hypothetical protein DWQ40_08565 [Actinomycetota bacterium]